MAIFKRNEAPPPRPRERSVPVPRGGSGDGAISIIGQGMTIVGDISTDGTVRVEGEVHGTIRAGKSIILGPAGFVEGNIYTNDAVLGGTVRGSIVATNRLELQGTCVVDGEISTRAEHLKLEEGARFSGQVVILEGEADEAEGAVGSSSKSRAPDEWRGAEEGAVSVEGSAALESGTGYESETGVSPVDESFR